MIGTWPDVADILNSELHYEFCESRYRKQFQAFQKMLNANEKKFVSDDTYLKQIQSEKRDIQVERFKLQTEKIENNRWLREYARDELIVEKIVDAIKELKPLKVPEVIPVVHNQQEGTLAFGDEHYGIEFEKKGLRGETINAYNPEIFEDRMWDLLHQTVGIIQKEGLTKLNIFNIGDSCEGVLRAGQLMKLRYGVVESTVRYANFICEWLNVLSDYVNIVYQMTSGNHTELRFFNLPKGSFENENMELVIREMIKARLNDNPNFTIIENPTGHIFDTISGSNVMGIHGDTKGLSDAIKDFSNTYKIGIDILVGGHYHHNKSETVGVNRDVINIPSIIGIDDYSMSLNKTSNAGATLFMLEEGRGKVMEYNIKLN
jgi:hypothetical protein